MFGKNKEAKPGKYGTSKGLNLQPGDIIVISGAPMYDTGRYITQTDWSNSSARGVLQVGEVTHVADPSYGTKYSVLASVGNDLYGHYRGEYSVHEGFVGITRLRRGINPPEDGDTVVYPITSLDGILPITISEIRHGNESFFSIAVGHLNALNGQEARLQIEKPKK